MADRKKRDEEPELEPEQEMLVREINQELKQDKYKKVWAKYGNLAIAFAVVVVLGVGGFKYWQSQQEKSRVAASDRYAVAVALIKDGKTKEATDALASLVRDAPSGYAALDIESQRALLLTRQLPALPAQFPDSTLTVHLRFQYQR